MRIIIDQVQVERVMTALQQQGMPCPLDHVAELCPELTWDQAFLAIDYLTRTGQVRLTLDAGLTYRVEAFQTRVATCSAVSPESHGPSETD